MTYQTVRDLLAIKISNILINLYMVG